MEPWLGMVIGGALGGTIQNFTLNEHRIIWPARAPAGGLAPGFLGDAGAGALVALVMAAVARLLCNEYIVKTMGLGADPPAGTTPLIIVTIGVGLAVGFAWRKVLPRLSDGVAALITSEVEKKTKGLSKQMDQKVDEGTQLANEAVQQALDALRRALEMKGTPVAAPPGPVPPRPATATLPNPAAGAPVAAPTASPVSAAGPAHASPVVAQPTPASLQTLIDEYEKNTQIPDWVQRLARKEELAGQMAALALANGVTPAALVADFQRTRQEGYVLALASLLIVDPQPEDIAALLAVSANLERLHVRYRVVTAFGALADRRFLRDDQRGSVRERIESFRKGADGSLTRRIDATLRRLG